jgi:tetrahydromethanopterin S-methyltransferase subunit B
MKAVNSNQDMLYRFAHDCAMHKYKNDCNHQCHACPSNISLYDIDKRTAVMIQHNVERKIVSEARSEAYLNSIAEQKRWIHGLRASMTIFTIVGAIIICNLWDTDSDYKKSSRPIPVVAEKPATTVVPEKPKPVVTVDNMEPVRVTLRRIYEVDMTGEGKINCIDYAIQFWNSYPDKSKVQIIWNNNPSTNFNHLFVKVNGLAIEPAAYHLYDTPEHWFSVRKIWKDRYDPAKDVDVTRHIDKIKADTYWIGK